MNWVEIGTWTLIALKGCLLLGFLVTLIYRSRLFPCPKCQKKNSRDFIREDEVSCQHCGWKAIPQSHQVARQRKGPTFHEFAECHACDSQFSSTELIAAWDGKKYCRECLHNVSPKLLQEVRKQRRLQESLEVSRLKTLGKAWVYLWTGINAVFLIPILCAGLGGEHDANLFEFFLMFQLLVGPLSLAFAIATGIGALSRIPSVTLIDGKLTIRAGTSWSTSLPLEQTEWFRGNLSMMSSPVMNFFSGPAIVLVLPDVNSSKTVGKKHPDFQMKYAVVGYTSKTRELWEGLLTLSGVTERKDLEKPKSRWEKFIEKAGPILLLPGGFLFGFLVGGIAFFLTNMLTGDREFASQLGGISLIHTSIFSILYAQVCWPKSMKPDPEKNGVNNDAIKPWGFRLASIFIASMVGISIWRAVELPAAQKFVILLVQFVFALGLGYDLDRRVRKNQESITRHNDQFKL